MRTITVESLQARVEEIEQALDQFTEDRISYACENQVPTDSLLFIEMAIKYQLDAIRAFLIL